MLATCTSSQAPSYPLKALGITGHDDLFYQYLYLIQKSNANFCVLFDCRRGEIAEQRLYLMEKQLIVLRCPQRQRTSAFQRIWTSLPYHSSVSLVKNPTGSCIKVTNAVWKNTDVFVLYVLNNNIYLFPFWFIFFNLIATGLTDQKQPCCEGPPSYQDSTRTTTVPDQS